MDKLWLEQARAAHDVASGLSVYIEHSDRYATEIAAAMTDLLAISVLYRRLDDVDRPSEYGRSFYRISNDLDVVVYSLQLTLSSVRTMFRKTRDGEESAGWEVLELHMRAEGAELGRRLKWYKAMLEDLFDVLKGYSRCSLALSPC